MPMKVLHTFIWSKINKKGELVMLTSEEYVAKKGLVCPNCGQMPEQRSFEADDNGFYANCYCVCGAEWVETYILTGFEQFFLPEKTE